MKRMGLKFLAPLSLFMLFSCASIVSKSQYPITVSSSPDNAIIIIENKAGEQVFKGTTPTTVTLNASAGFFSGERYTVTYEKDGYESSVRTISSELDGWYIGNILLGGVIGMLIVDPATGAMWKLPEKIDASLGEASRASNSDRNEFKIVSINDIPPSLRTELVMID